MNSYEAFVLCTAQFMEQLVMEENCSLNLLVETVVVMLVVVYCNNTITDSGSSRKGICGLSFPQICLQCVTRQASVKDYAFITGILRPAY